MSIGIELPVDLQEELLGDDLIRDVTACELEPCVHLVLIEYRHGVPLDRTPAPRG